MSTSSSECRRRVNREATANYNNEVGDRDCMDDKVKDKKFDNDTTVAPRYLRGMITLFRACPKVCKIPFTKVDITFALLSALVLHAIRLVVTPLMIAKGGWPAGHKYTLDAVSSIVSMMHAMLLVSSLWFCLFPGWRYKPCAKFSETPQWHRDASTALTNMCIGYMLQDTIVCSLLGNYTPQSGLQLTMDDYAFIGHHLITIIYMVSTLIIQAGHFSAMMLMFTGEITNPTFNLYLMYTNAVKLDFCCGITPERYQIIAVVNAIPYLLLRTFIGPLVVVHLGYDILLRKQGRTNIPVPLGIFFVFCGFLVLWGSIPWCNEAWAMIVDAMDGKSLADRLLLHPSNVSSVSS
jgi:hypothetical protein